MKTLTCAVAALALGFGGAAFAQASGGPDAKGNAPLKAPHTVNDGSAKRGANSFTEKQARQHIEKSGFTGVSNLAKGDDGVWRGQAMRDGQTVAVAMDFKGNVSTAGSGMAAVPAVPANSGAMAASSTMAAPGADQTMSKTTSTTTTTAQAGDATTHHMRHRHHRRHMRHVACANPTPNGAACSGVDRNHNGISDKEDHAIHEGAHP